MDVYRHSSRSPRVTRTVRVPVRYRTRPSHHGWHGCVPVPIHVMAGGAGMYRYTARSPRVARTRTGTHPLHIGWCGRVPVPYGTRPRHGGWHGRVPVHVQVTAGGTDVYRYTSTSSRVARTCTGTCPRLVHEHIRITLAHINVTDINKCSRRRALCASLVIHMCVGARACRHIGPSPLIVQSCGRPCSCNRGVI